MVIGTALAVLLTGCVAGESPEPAASAPIAPSSSPEDESEPSPLLPVYPDGYTIDNVQAETERVAVRITGLVAVAGLLGQDTYSQEVENTEREGSYWGVLNTITLEPDVEAEIQAASVAADLADAGWLLVDGAQSPSDYAVALTSSEDPERAWFLVLGADLSVPGESVVTVRLSSPPLP
ncbi:hypothetical protein BHD05_14245 [Marisediminicola antarctica]|uniref:Uncharacterized protein n=1 Tax=Marisediminicola antarctica TaxID=674079 RepID=A0A7L5AKN1_9MICO|nr:hypothetical protein BHD05_14245 [Marisediminicola antarctica]